jgi:hypothetical protein
VRVFSPSTTTAVVELHKQITFMDIWVACEVNLGVFVCAEPLGSSDFNALGGSPVESDVGYRRRTEVIQANFSFIIKTTLQHCRGSADVP